MNPKDVFSSTTKEVFLSRLSYNSQTGDFHWVSSGKIAGTVDRLGYRRICFEGNFYYAHRLAWFLVHGVWPIDQIDHVNGNPKDNRLDNLREASHSNNKKNCKTRKDNVLNIKGVDHRGNGKYRARIFHGNRHINLGTYKTPEEAHAAYVAKAKELHQEFMRAN